MNNPRSQHKTVIIVGAGFAGIGAAIKLKEAGIEFLILEKANSIGGVWRENTYPDCACDIPSALYSYSFANNPHWSQLYAGQKEIERYTNDIVKTYAIESDIHLNHAVVRSSWNNNSLMWELETNEKEYTANFVIMACGPMHEPVIPDVAGLDTFTGDTFHSTNWNHDIDLKGKKVAVIGSGASSIQFLPAIQPSVEALALFQRTPPWVIPKLDRAISKNWQRRFAKYPILQRTLRSLLFLQFECLNIGLKRKRFIKLLQCLAIRNIDKSILDESLKRRLIPKYDIGCKRILQSNNWYQALAKPNVTVASGIAKIQGSTVTDEGGASFEADVIIFATGFQVANPPVADIIYGSTGQSLAEQWQGSPEVYKGTMAHNAPNCFLTFGPNLYTFTSAFVIIEAQLNLISSAITTALKDEISVIRVNPDMLSTYNEKLQHSLQKTVWNSGGCTSYFIDKNGRNSTNWPWTTFKLKRELNKFNACEYLIDHTGQNSHDN